MRRRAVAILTSSMHLYSPLSSKTSFTALSFFLPSASANQSPNTSLRFSFCPRFLLPSSFSFGVIYYYYNCFCYEPLYIYIYIVCMCVCLWIYYSSLKAISGAFHKFLLVEGPNFGNDCVGGLVLFFLFFSPSQIGFSCLCFNWNFGSWLSYYLNH